MSHGAVKTSFPATQRPDPTRVSEGFLKDPHRVLIPVSQRKDPSKLLQNTFKNPSKTLLGSGVEIDVVLGFPGLKNQFQGPGAL